MSHARLVLRVPGTLAYYLKVTDEAQTAARLKRLLPHAVRAVGPCAAPADVSLAATAHGVCLAVLFLCTELTPLSLAGHSRFRFLVVVVLLIVFFLLVVVSSLVLSGSRDTSA